MVVVKQAPPLELETDEEAGAVGRALSDHPGPFRDGTLPPPNFPPESDATAEEHEIVAAATRGWAEGLARGTPPSPAIVGHLRHHPPSPPAEPPPSFDCATGSRSPSTIVATRCGGGMTAAFALDLEVRLHHLVEHHCPHPPPLILPRLSRCGHLHHRACRCAVEEEKGGVASGAGEELEGEEARRRASTGKEKG
ncbi:hypothetical protein E2562_009415 [Oryza meyeriana var. granulata]|uniref:Uncharacterized protein n=1 Tax=Oryza meyeriana var. granulata TaxID=110450 RepID=A0A6G1BU06_9ORYZ|nr:hypothetical protein E2562_009415 [Oryza meyeriana var. granulata]